MITIPSLPERFMLRGKVLTDAEVNFGLGDFDRVAAVQSRPNAKARPWEYYSADELKAYAAALAEARGRLAPNLARLTGELTAAQAEHAKASSAAAEALRTDTRAREAEAQAVADQDADRVLQTGERARRERIALTFADRALAVAASKLDTVSQAHSATQQDHDHVVSEETKIAAILGALKFREKFSAQLEQAIGQVPAQHRAMVRAIVLGAIK